MVLREALQEEEVEESHLGSQVPAVESHLESQVLAEENHREEFDEDCHEDGHEDYHEDHHLVVPMVADCLGESSLEAGMDMRDMNGWDVKHADDVKKMDLA